MQYTVIDNRYKVLKKVGTGATGDVYKIRDFKNNSNLALKILSKKKLSSVAVQRFKREFRLLAELRHPNLCPVYDFGMLDDGRSYFTMEYIDGKDILKAAKRVSYEKMYSWVVQLCRALEYIHSKGLIHYDVKPGNVLIQVSSDSNDNVFVKLMDFGLAGEKKIKGGTLIRGTFPYIAPEVIKGLAVDHRADLYSLGILLFEIFTRRAFQECEESFVTLLQQKMDQVSNLPSQVVADMPKGLEQLIVRLLSSEPAARFSHANEIIREINKISRLKFALETEKTLEGYLLSSRFVGRDKEMDLLKSVYQKALHGEGQVVLVTGEAGIGKSRLLNEFRIFTQLERSHCFIGSANKDRTGPLEPFSNIFRELINYVSISTDLSRSRKIRTALAVLFRIFPDLAVRHLRKNLPRLVPLEPKQEQLRNFEVLSELVGYSVSALGELVILLEDLHWADDLTIQFLEYLSRNLENRSILICGSCRTEELKENPVLEMMVSNLKNENYLTQIELGPLKFRNLYSFLDSTITPESNSSALVQYLMGKTSGNPFFVEEIMRALLREGKVGIGEKIEIEAFKQITIPEKIEDIVLKRLKDLDSTSQKVVNFGAIILKDFSYDLMKRLVGLEDTELSRAFWELKRRQVLIEEGIRFRFYHATLREAINNRMAYREKRKLYYQLGKTLELIYKRNTEGVVEDLAYYFINARDNKKGIRYGLRAAKRCSGRYANEQAIRFYKGILGLLSGRDQKLRFNVLQKLAQIEDLVGYHNDAIKHYRNALSLSISTIDKKIKVYLGLADVCEIKGDYNEALQIYQKAIRLLRKMKSGRLKALLEANINARICVAYFVMGDYEKAIKFNVDALQYLKGSKGKEAIRLQAGIYHTMGIIESHKGEYGIGDYDKAISYYKEAYKYHKKIKNEVGVAAVLNNLGISYSYKFDYQKATNCHQRAIQIAKKIGDQYAVSAKLFNLADVFKKKGNYSKALDYFQKALAISKKIGSRYITGASLLEIGDCFLQLCDYKVAKEYFEKPLKIFDITDKGKERVYQLNGIGDVYKALGNYCLALKFYRKALKIARDIGHQNSVADVLISNGSVFTKIGELSRAKRNIEDALQSSLAIEAKDVTIRSYIGLCRINVIMKDYVAAKGYYNKGIKLVKEIGMKPELLQFYLLLAEIYYHDEKYLRAIEITSKAIKLAKEMGAKDLYAEALLIKMTNAIKQGILSTKETLRILDEAKKIAKEISNPEILWKVYFTCGRFFQDNKQYRKASKYYQKCIDVFKSVISRMKNESRRKSYLNRPDRRAAITAMNKI